MSTLFEQAVEITKAHSDATLVEIQRKRIQELEDQVYDLKNQLRESEQETEETRDQLSDLRRRRH